MYSVRRGPTQSYYYSQYWTTNCQQQHQQFVFHNRHVSKTRQQYFWSTKPYNGNNAKDSHIQYDCVKPTDTSLPVYRAPCTFQNSLETTSKGNSPSRGRSRHSDELLDGYPCGLFRRSPLSSSSCVPDVYSPGSTSSGNCSPPPPSSNLPPPPSEWLH